MRLKERIYEQLTSTATGKMSRISLKKAIYAKGVNQKSRSAFNAAIDQLCESGTISKIGGHSVCLQTMSGNTLGTFVQTNSSTHFNFVSQNVRKIAVTDEDKINHLLQNTYNSEVHKFGEISFEKFNKFVEHHKDTLSQNADVFSSDRMNLYKTTLSKSQSMFNCLKKQSQLVKFPKLRGQDLIRLIESKIHYFWIVDAVFYDTPLSETSKNYALYKQILDKDMRNETLSTTEWYAILELGSFLAHAHDFCNLISFAGIILLACLEKDGEKILHQYCSEFGEDFKIVQQCNKENSSDNDSCSKHIALVDMNYVLGELILVMQKEKTRWENQLQSGQEAKPWMLNDRVLYVWNKMNEYLAEKNKARDEAEMLKYMEMFSMNEKKKK